MSTYIRIFFEKENNDISWETLHISNCYRDYYKEKQKKVGTAIGMSGAIHLGFLSTMFYCGYTLKELYVDGKFVLRIENIFLIILSIVLFIFLIILNRAFYKDYDQELERLMEDYKKERKDNT